LALRSSPSPIVSFRAGGCAVFKTMCGCRVSGSTSFSETGDFGANSTSAAGICSCRRQALAWPTMRDELRHASFPGLGKRKSAAGRARNLERFEAGRFEILVEHANRFVANRVLRSRNGVRGNRNAAGQRLKLNDAECVGSAREHENVCRRKMGRQGVVKFTFGEPGRVVSSAEIVGVFEAQSRPIFSLKLFNLTAPSRFARCLVDGVARSHRRRPQMEGYLENFIFPTLDSGGAA